MTDTLTPCLWFDRQAEEAALFYTGLFPDSRIDRVDYTPADYPAGKVGDVLMVEFTLAGRGFLALNGGAGPAFTAAVSLSFTTEDQAETDRLWEALIADGGAPVQCGWLRDRYGLSWQIVPRRMQEMLAAPDRAAAARAMAAMMGMVKLDIAALERAFAGDA